MNKRTIYNIAIILICIICLIPMVTISRYNHPSADDYSYTILTHKAWLQTHSVFQVVKAAVETSIKFWNEWQGLYSSAFVLALQPAIFGEKYYAITGILLMLVIIISNCYFTFYFMYKKLEMCLSDSMALGMMLSFIVNFSKKLH